MIREIFSGADNRLSSKRILGAIVTIFSMVITVIVIYTKYDHNILFYPYFLSGGLLGSGVLEGMGRNAPSTIPPSYPGR